MKLFMSIFFVKQIRLTNRVIPCIYKRIGLFQKKSAHGWRYGLSGRGGVIRGCNFVLPGDHQRMILSVQGEVIRSWYCVMLKSVWLMNSHCWLSWMPLYLIKCDWAKRERGAYYFNSSHSVKLWNWRLVAKVSVVSIIRKTISIDDKRLFL